MVGGGGVRRQRQLRAVRHSAARYLMHPGSFLEPTASISMASRNAGILASSISTVTTKVTGGVDFCAVFFLRMRPATPITAPTPAARRSGAWPLMHQGPFVDMVCCRSNSAAAAVAAAREKRGGAFEEGGTVVSW